MIKIESGGTMKLFKCTLKEAESYMNENYTFTDKYTEYSYFTETVDTVIWRGHIGTIARYDYIKQLLYVYAPN